MVFLLFVFVVCCCLFVVESNRCLGVTTAHSPRYGDRTTIRIVVQSMYHSPEAHGTGTGNNRVDCRPKYRDTSAVGDRQKFMLCMQLQPKAADPYYGRFVMVIAA